MVRPIAFDVPARYPRALTAHVYKATASRYDPTLCHVTRSPGAHTLPRRFLSLFYTHLFPIFSLFRFRLLPFLSLLPILVPFPITSSHSSLLSSQISLFLLFSPVLVFYYINFFDHYFQPYSSLSSISRIQLFSFSLLLRFSFISTIWLDEDDEAHVSYTVSQPEADEKPNLPSHLTLLNFFRARVFSGTTRGACAFIARELREGLHLYETQMSNTTSASKQIKRECIYIFWNRGSSNFDRVVY